MDFGISAARWAVSKAMSPIADGFLAWAASNGLGPNVDALTQQLLNAQVMLEDAQDREIRSPTLRKLLLKLRGLAYNADDVLDELDYFHIDNKVRAAGGCVHVNARRAVASKLKEPSTSRRLKFDRVEFSRKMEGIVEQLKQVCAMVSTILNLQPYRINDIAVDQPKTTSIDTAVDQPKTTSYFIPELYGRGNTIRSIVDRITLGEYSANKLTVLAIVGPGGIGKTTFTQHLYHEVKSQFDVLIWVCVSLNFNANRLAHEILKQIPTVEGEKENASQEELIEQRLRNKRFLLVLDDIWNFEEDEWKKLLSPFCEGEGKGNMVIVTTRFPQVAKMVTSRDGCLIELERLEQADLLEFLGACVFGEEGWKGHDAFNYIGRQIVETLRGSPLAAKIVGGLLRNQLSLEHWTRILENKVWEQPTSNSDIMPALKLSYNYLPFHLQQCFIYCALFPEDYEFDRNELIHLWIGLDILPSPNQNKGIEDVGHSCLEDLVNHGFLKRNERDNGHPYYVLHDLLHELAVKVSSEECLSIFSSSVRSIRSTPIPTTVRHLSIFIDEEVVKDRVTFEHFKRELSVLGKRLKVKNLRTLMLFGEYHECLFNTFCDLFKEATTLRIVLCKASYNVEDLLPNLSKLVHLRYIRIKRGIFGKSCLPGTISRLYQLKIIDAQECSGSSELPRDINNLLNLEYFLVSDDRLHSGIVEVGKLQHLRKLQRFEVKRETDASSKKKKTNGFELKQLGKLLELQVLGIYNLGNVAVNEEASEANLTQKDRLQELILDWHIEGTEKPMQEDDILECLKPHSNLQKLCIRGHGGTKCPTWLGMNLSVQHLEYLHLDDVAWEELPSLGGLHMLKESGEISPSPKFMNLKRLELINVRNLKKWVGIGSCHLFSHLEVLVIKYCEELLELSFSDPTCHQLEEVGNMDSFSNLKELEIVGCPKLSHLPSVPWTCTPCSAKIEGIGSSFEEIDYTRDFELGIQGKDSDLDSTFWNVLAFDNLIGLKELRVEKCPALSFDQLEKLPSLKSLTIYESNAAVWLAENEGRVKYKFPIEYIRMCRCKTNGKELTRLLSYFPRLSTLVLLYPEKITGVSVADHLTMTTTTTSFSSSSANEVEGMQTAHHQQQMEAEGEEEIHAASAAADGLLLLPPQLEELQIYACIELSLHHPNTEAGGTGGGLQGLCCLRSLEIWECPRFLSSNSASSSFPIFFPASLQSLKLYRVEGKETQVVCLSNLTSLTDLSISDCGDLRVEGLWPLLAHGRLTTIDVTGTPNFFVGCESPPQEGGIPPRSSSNDLQSLSLCTDDAVGVLATPICTLLSSSLTTLTFAFDDNLEHFTKEQEEALQRLASLQDLRFWDFHQLQCLPVGLHTLPNLKRLQILFCKAFRSLPKGGLPSSLQELRLQSCSAIQSLPKDTLPSSLQELRLQSCSAIRSLPKDALPSSLQVLEISNCPAIRSLPKVDSLPSSLRELDVQYSDSDELIRQCCKLRGIIPIVRA